MTYKLKCTTSYDGSRFHGFQKQVKQRTVQQEIEKALALIHKHVIIIHASGRTDTNVHALGQVFHFETDLNIAPANWKKALNSILPDDIYIKEAEDVDLSFHSRFDALIKEYHYFLSIDEYNPLKSQYIYYHRFDLDIERMKQAIKYFVGEHDFTSFTSNKTKKNKVRTIYEAAIINKGKELEFLFRGSGFLRYQIRIMVGTLIEIGQGKRDVSSINDIFEQKDRKKAGPTAKPQGLYLYKVEY